jgi:NAD(P)-dependent dehydrogenase (short-subunit alcohol dehydrogenase family)
MRTVVITGAGSGIGAATTVRLDRCGWRVFAGVHSRHEGEVLDRQTSDHVTVHQLDVSSPDLIKAFAGEVDLALGGDGLDALVDNAGKGFLGPLETLPIESLREQFEVNVIGQVAVTQQFLPMLRRSEGSRLVFVGSVGGRVAAGFAGAYYASKHALEAIADAWRQELTPEGIHVVIVEPGPLATPIWSKAAKTLDSLPPNDLYRDRLDALRRRVERRGKDSAGPAEAVELIVRAVTASRPHTRYANGLAATVLPAVRQLIPDRVFDRLALRITTSADVGSGYRSGMTAEPNPVEPLGVPPEADPSRATEPNPVEPLGRPAPAEPEGPPSTDEPDETPRSDVPDEARRSDRQEGAR